MILPVTTFSVPVCITGKSPAMNTDQIKRHLSDKGTAINDHQAAQILDVICTFKAEMKQCQPDKEWTFDVEQVGTDSFTFEYTYRVTQLITL